MWETRYACMICAIRGGQAKWASGVGDLADVYGGTTHCQEVEGDWPVAVHRRFYSIKAGVCDFLEDRLAN